VLLKKITCDTEGIDGRIPKRFLKNLGSEGTGCIDAWQGAVKWRALNNSSEQYLLKPTNCTYLSP